MKIPFVDLNQQYLSIKSEIDNAIADVIAKSAFVGGEFVKSFEEEFAKFCGAEHCVGVGNGTDAIFIALKCLNIGKGDEVITAANTFIATSEAITMAGAKVVFVDINPKTYNIDIEKIEEKITKNTRAIIPIHLYGQPADMEPILNLAAQYNLHVIEDACQAHGAEYKGKKAGTIGNVGCFSFYPGKNLGAYGDGGAIITNDQKLSTKAKMIANHGRVEKYNHEIEGVNSRLDGLQAAILKVKLAHLDEWTEFRRKNAYHYNDCLKDCGVVTPTEIDDVWAVYHLYVVKVNKERRQQLQEYLKSEGIITGIHYPIILPRLNAYTYLEQNNNHFKIAKKTSEEILSLPMFPELTPSQIEYIAEKIKNFLN